MTSFLMQHKKALQILGLLLVAFALLVFIYSLKSIFNPVLLSFVIAYILNPLPTFLERCHIPRTLSIFSLYLLLTALIVFIFILLIPLIAGEVSYLYEKAFVGDHFQDTNGNQQWDEGEVILHDLDGNDKYDQPYFAIFIEWLKAKVGKWNAEHPTQPIDWVFIREQVLNKESVESVGKMLLAFSKTTLLTAFNTMMGMFWLLSYLILLPLYTFFLLQGMNNIRDTVYGYFPGNQRDVIIRILQRIHIALSSFFRGKLIICFLKGFLTWACLEMLGLRYSLIFGAIQMVASIVPFLVLLVGMGPNLFLVFLDQGFHFPYLIGIVIIYSILEGLESFVFTPLIMGKETGMHPLTLILSLLIGGELFGLFGLIMAIPLCNTLKILAQEFLLPAWLEVSHCQPYLPNGIPKTTK